VILVDAGALVAVLVRNHPGHGATVRALKDLDRPLGTVWPVVVRALEDLRAVPPAQDALWTMLERGAPRLLALDDADVARVRELMRPSRRGTLDVATASLLRVAERDGVRQVLTTQRAMYAGRRLKGIP
jgi:predicted nucleic acid-binding protein